MVLGSTLAPNFKEIQCMGFNLTDTVTKIRKGFVQIDMPYYNLKEGERDEAYCSVFESALREGPMNIFN
jgi:hypothetical protein